jgi:ectoine hydroxylase-related dioxygenase (phytanoyl-CoA dioxygenase family)
MPKLLSAAQIHQYDRDGYISPIPVLSTEEIHILRAGFEHHAHRLKGKLGQQYKHKTHLMRLWADALVHHPHILDAVEDVLGPNILCWTTNLFVKGPGQPHYVSWHQDSSYWGLEPDEVLTAWVALSPSTRQSGCLKVIPGTHVGQNQLHEDSFDPNNQLTRGQAMVNPDEDAAVSLALEPGEMSIHHVKVAHASGPNQSQTPRLGFAMRFMSTNVQKAGKRESALLVRGTDTRGFFEHETRPSVDFSLDSRLAHNRALRRQIGNNFGPKGNTPLGQRMQLGLQKWLSQAAMDAGYCRLKMQTWMGRR